MDWTAKVSALTRRRVEILYSSMGFKTFEDYLEALGREVLIEMDDNTFVDHDTLRALLPEWCKNAGANYSHIVAGHDIAELPRYFKAGSKRAIVVGGGPSVQRRGHLGQLRECLHSMSTYRPFFIVATDKMAAQCIENKIILDLVVSLDSNLKIREFLTDHVLKAMNKVGAALVLSVTSPPELVAAASKHRVRCFFHIPWIEAKFAPNVALMLHSMFDGKVSTMNAAGNCGGLGWVAACAAGCRKVALIGMDMGYYPDQRLDDTAYAADIRRMAGNDPEKFGKFFSHYEHKCWGVLGGKYLTDFVFQGYLDTFLALIKGTPAVQTFNCTEGGVLCGERMKGGVPNLKCIKFKDFLEARG